MRYEITDQIKDCIERYSFDKSYITIMAGGCWISMMHRDQKPIHLLIEDKKQRVRIWNQLESEIDSSEFDNIATVIKEAIKANYSSNSYKHEDADFGYTDISLTEDNDLCFESSNIINEDAFEYTIIRMIDGFMSRKEVVNKALMKG